MLFIDARIQSLLWNTAALAAGAIGLSLPLGIVLTVLCTRTDLPGRRLFIALLVLMLFLPLYVQAAAWQAGFGLQGWFSSIFAEPGTVPVLEGWLAAVWVHSMAAIPWVVLIVGLALRLVEPELEEDALLDARAGKVFIWVTLPRVWPAVGIAAVWVAMTVTSEITVTDLFQVRTYAEELYTNFALGDPAEARLGWLPIGVLSVLLTLGGLTLAAAASLSGEIPNREPMMFSLGRWKMPCLVAIAAIMFLLVAVPVGNLCYMCGVVVERSGSDLVHHWSLAKCLALIATSPVRYSSAFGASFLISGLAATAAVLVSVPLAWWAGRGGWRAALVLGIAAACLALPGPVLGLGLIELLSRPAVPWLHYLYDRTILAPCVVQFIKGLPAALLILWFALRTVPAETIEMALLDGAGPLRRLLSIALPQRRPALAVAWLTAFALALGDLSATILVIPPGVTTLSIQIFNDIHYGVGDRLAGICLSLIALFATLGGVVAMLTRRQMRES